MSLICSSMAHRLKLNVTCSFEIVNYIVQHMGLLIEMSCLQGVAMMTWRERLTSPSYHPIYIHLPQMV